MTTKVGYLVSEIGVPEVDRVIQGSIFSAKTNDSYTKLDLPKLDRICWKFQRHVDTDTQSRKFQRRTRSLASMDKNTKEDRISDLPDEILVFIISLLTMREGAATSILSRRWRNLWSTSVSCYNFDLSNMSGYNYLNHDFRLPSQRVLRCEKYLFTRWVNQVLELHRAPKINALRISFVLGKESASQINRWINHAASQGLTQLELDFELLYVGISCATAYEFPFQLFASLKYLRLNCCYFNYPPNFKGFDSLVSLALEKTFLPEHGLQNILSNCSVLESLSLLCCWFDGFLNNLKFSGLSLPLKHLHLHMVTPDAITKIEVHDINLVSLEFNGSSSTTVSIKNTPHLARLVLFTRTPVEILSNIPRLETLFFTPRVKVSILPKLYVFNNLKRLVFLADGSATNLVEAIYLLKACPLLQKLELDMAISDPVVGKSLTSITTRHGAPHGNLKEVEIYGFQDHLEKVELVVYLLRNAVVLEKMTIFSISKTYLGNGEWNLLEETVKQSQMRLKKVWKLLQKEALPSTKLVFCPHE